MSATIDGPCASRWSRSSGDGIGAIKVGSAAARDGALSGWKTMLPSGAYLDIKIKISRLTSRRG